MAERLCNAKGSESKRAEKKERTREKLRKGQWQKFHEDPSEWVRVDPSGSADYFDNVMAKSLSITGQTLENGRQFSFYDNIVKSSTPAR